MVISALIICLPPPRGEASSPLELFPNESIQKLNTERIELLDALSELPPRNVRNSNGFLGYHSAIIPQRSTDRPLNNTIDFHLQRGNNQRIKMIALMPAFNPQIGPHASYGFPLRFRIELRDHPQGEPIKVFDFTREDFPEPGLSPVVIPDIDLAASTVRLVVTKGVVKDRLEYFALGEVYIITADRAKKQANATPYAKVEVTNVFESLPFWSINHLNDRVSALGMPLGSKRKGETDFVSVIPIQEQEAPITVTIDLGRVRANGRVSFFPAQSPWEISLPHFGFPDKITVEGFKSSDFNATPTFRQKIEGSWNKRKSLILGDVFFAVPLYGKHIRYVRLTFNKLPTHGSSRIFAIGEISVFDKGENISTGKSIRVKGLKQSDLDTSLLLDNHAYGHELLSTGEWLLGLAERHKREAELAEIDSNLIELNRRLDRNTQIVIAITLLLLAGLGLGMYIRSRLTRARDMKQVRTQISSDLHDDVGSSIGALSLGLERLRNHKHSDNVDSIIQDLRQVGKEAAVALREAVWLTKQNSISLLSFGTMLKERSHFTLGKNRVRFKIDGNLPEMELSLIHKRNILLFFKEALHNFIKHAQAKHIEISIKEFDPENLLLQIEDNGIGIDSKKKSKNGWGLSTMKRRAKEMGGALQITSSVEAGTCLKLTIPYATLRKK